MRISRSGKKVLVITAGDPSGVGPEVILKSLARLKPFKKIIPVVIGDRAVFRKYETMLKAPLPRQADFVDAEALRDADFRPGMVCRRYGDAAMQYLALGVSVVQKCNGAALVTAPINKESINKAGFKFAGHTEYLSRVTNSNRTTMMLVGGPLRVSLVTRHVPLKKVANYLTGEKIILAIENTHCALKKLFRITRPRIGVTALNPHAGEGGILGAEEKRLISPAVKYTRKRIKGITGPLPADTLFYRAYNGGLDAVVCMYHDQALIPLKMVAFDKGVNLTLGLPFIRTSPDHGTGFDIAGRGKADPSSMIEAIKLAARLSRKSSAKQAKLHADEKAA